MARILGSEGLILNQSNGNAYMRLYSRGKNDVGPYIRFTISSGNPALHVFVKTYFAFSQTNGSFDYNSSMTIFQSIYCDTGGSVTVTNGTQWTSGTSIDRGFNTTTRQADLWISTYNNGGFPGRASINCEIYCDRWDYLSLSNL